MAGKPKSYRDNLRFIKTYLEVRENNGDINELVTKFNGSYTLNGVQDRARRLRAQGIALPSILTPNLRSREGLMPQEDIDNLNRFIAGWRGDHPHKPRKRTEDE